MILTFMITVTRVYGKEIVQEDSDTQYWICRAWELKKQTGIESKVQQKKKKKARIAAETARKSYLRSVKHDTN